MLLVSILGDSISTYEGFNPPHYSVFYESENLRKNWMRSVYDTWWAKVNQYLHACICVSNAYSGSRVTGKRFPSASCMERTQNLHSSVGKPDIVLIYIGFNDFADGTPIWANGGEDAFENAYRLMLQNIKRGYPESVIICGTLMQTYIADMPHWHFPEKWSGVSFSSYNEAIRRSALYENCLIADLAATGNKYQTLDGTHPTRNGHAEIAETWIRCIHGLLEILKLKKKL